MIPIFRKFGLFAAITLVILLASGAGVVYAQIEFGFKAGVVLADQKFEYYGFDFERDISLRTGLGLGFSVDHTLGSLLGLRFEALYLQKGYEEKVKLTNELSDVVGTGRFKSRVDMLSLNLLGRARLISGTYALAGPRLDIRLSSFDDFPRGTYPQFLEDNFKTTIAGLTFGLGQKFELPKRNAFFIEAQYYLDLGKLFDQSGDNDELPELISIKNRSFAFFAGIRL